MENYHLKAKRRHTPSLHGMGHAEHKCEGTQLYGEDGGQVLSWALAVPVTGGNSTRRTAPRRMVCGAVAFQGHWHSGSFSGLWLDLQRKTGQLRAKMSSA